jgi:PAS domain S-box-containing protein
MDVIGQKCYKVLQGLDAPCEFCTNDIILKQKPDPHHWEFYNKKYDRYYSLVDRIIRWPDGRDVRFEMAVDITERKKGEEQIELLAQMVAIAPGAIIIHDFEGQIFYANQRAAQMHGCTVEEFLALNLRDIDVPETADLIPARMEELIQNGEINFEGRHKRMDGTAYPVQVYAKKIEWADKPAILSITTDITERKRAEEALRVSESQFRSLFDNAADAIFIAEAESGIIVNANQTAVKLLSTSIENIIGKHQSELHPQEINNHSETSFQKHKIEIEEMNLANPIESVVLSSNGSEIPVEVLASKVLYQGKNCIMGIFRDITERKKTEKELRESEEQYRTLVENLNEAVMLVDLDDRIHFVNNKFTELLGYSQDEIIGKIGYEILIPPQEQLLIIEANTDRKKGLSGQYEVNFVKKNGDLCCFLVNGSPVHNAEGEVIGSLGALTDITESKKSKEELERTRIQLIETIMQSPLPMVLASAEDYKLKVINKATEDFLLINAKDYLEKPLMEIDVVWQEYTPDGLKVEPSELPLPRALQGMVTNSKEMKLERIDGSTVWQLASGAPIFDSQGKLIAGLLVLQDITDRKRAERVQEILYNIALHIHLEKSTKELLEFVRQEIGTVMDTSNFFAAVYNPEKDTLKSIIFVDEVDDFAEDEWPASRTISGHVVKEGKTVFLRGEEIDEFYSKHNIGLEGTIPKCWIGVPIFSHAKSIGIMVIQNYKNYSTFSNWDVTMLEMIAHEIGVFIEKHTMIEELVKAKEKAEEMNRVKSIFFANMSHELRTPFVGITGFAELLADSLKNSEEKYMAEGILKSSSRMQDTLSKILGLAKLESDSVEVLKRKVNVNELILDLFESFRGGALLKNITFENNIIFNELIIESDDFIIKDILQNLVSNAIKCTNHGGVKIIAEVKKKNDLDFLVIKVADTGVGIPKEKLDIIWEPFRQASEGFSRNFEGTGLGLSIVKRSSELLGGILNVESEEGKGSVFTISFPIKIISRSVDVGVQNVELVNPTATNKRILYVEDDELSREVVKRFLLKTCEIEIADNASEAIEKVKSQIYDAILMDINLKGSKNGVDLMQEIRKHSNYEKIPIIALTAYASQDDKVKFLSQGFTQYISKPFKKLALIELISSVFTE